MNNFWQRLTTGTLFVVVLVASVLWSEYAFAFLFYFITVLGLREYAVLFKNKPVRPFFWVVVSGGGLITLLFITINLPPENQVFEAKVLEHFFHSMLIIAFMLFCLTPMIVYVFSVENIFFSKIIYTLAGILYISFGFICFISLGFFHFFPEAESVSPLHDRIALGFLILLWSSDTFAYLTGRAFGKTPLAPKISPKKTWEGSIGGAICTLLMGYVLYLTIGNLSLWRWIGLAIIIDVFGIIGDLIESKFKRIMGVKDSGSILPGHGGILDRFDSLLFSAPFSLLFLILTIKN